MKEIRDRNIEEPRHKLRPCPNVPRPDLVAGKREVGRWDQFRAMSGTSWYLMGPRARISSQVVPVRYPKHS